MRNSIGVCYALRTGRPGQYENIPARMDHAKRYPDVATCLAHAGNAEYVIIQKRNVLDGKDATGYTKLTLIIERTCFEGHYPVSITLWFGELSFAVQGRKGDIAQALASLLCRLMEGYYYTPERYEFVTELIKAWFDEEPRPEKFFDSQKVLQTTL